MLISVLILTNNTMLHSTMRIDTLHELSDLRDVLHIKNNLLIIHVSERAHGNRPVVSFVQRINVRTLIIMVILSKRNNPG